MYGKARIKKLFCYGSKLCHCLRAPFSQALNAFVLMLFGAIVCQSVFKVKNSRTNFPFFVLPLVRKPLQFMLCSKSLHGILFGTKHCKVDLPTGPLVNWMIIDASNEQSTINVNNLS